MSESNFSIWDFYCDICERHILPACAPSLRLTNPCAKRKVLSLTKPKGRIYNTKSLGHYITLRQTFICATYKSHTELSIEQIVSASTNMIRSKVGDRYQGRPEGSLFNSYYTKMLGDVPPFLGLLYFTLDMYLIMLSVKQGSFNYHFLSLWYDTTRDWKPLITTY